MVPAFFQALSPLELEVYARTWAAQQQPQRHIDHAHALERLRSQAALAPRQGRRGDPENRLVAAARENRWEAALRALKDAEAAPVPHQPPPVGPFALTAELREAFTPSGHQLPQIWPTPLVSPQHTNALLRGLLEKVVIHRAARELVQPRILGKGSDPTTVPRPISVGSLAELSAANEMAPRVRKLRSEGKSDQEIAQHVTDLNYRSPRRS